MDGNEKVHLLGGRAEVNTGPQAELMDTSQSYIYFCRSISLIPALNECPRSL